MPKPASGWIIPQRSMFDVPWHRTPRFRNGPELFIYLKANGFAFKSELVTASFFEPLHPVGLTRNYSNPCTH
jgi:hypothetical protein